MKSFDHHLFGPSDEAALLSAVTHGPVADAPPDALKAAKCECKKKGNEPWLERDIDGQLHCNRCGSDY